MESPYAVLAVFLVGVFVGIIVNSAYRRVMVSRIKKQFVRELVSATKKAYAREIRHA